MSEPQHEDEDKLQLVEYEAGSDYDEDENPEVVPSVDDFDDAA